MDDGAAKLAFLRHVLATIAYRGGKTLRGAPSALATQRAGAGSRSALEILAHLSDLFEWAASIALGRESWREAPPGDWDDQVARFHRTLGALDDTLAKGAPACPPERLFQGPLADALTHIGQIAMLRRLAGAPVRGENYFRAEIAAGRTGPDQAAPVREFD
jgi:hypothetical protein